MVSASLAYTHNEGGQEHVSLGRVAGLTIRLASLMKRFSKHGVFIKVQQAVRVIAVKLDLAPCPSIASLGVCTGGLTPHTVALSLGVMAASGVGVACEEARLALADLKRRSAFSLVRGSASSALGHEALLHRLYLPDWGLRPWREIGGVGSCAEDNLNCWRSVPTELHSDAQICLELFKLLL